MMNDKVLIALSGGVDSAVAAALLKKEGYDVIGVTMRLWDQESTETAIRDAAAVADTLGIPLHVLNLQDDFRRSVVDPFIFSYLSGNTPNPCVLCNRAMKWEALLSFADSIGASYLATGHYASIRQLPNGRMSICRAKSDRKDQTYALYRLSQEQLRRTLMPVGSYEKEEIRLLAAEFGLPISAKQDSQDICFIPDGDYTRFLAGQSSDAALTPGNFVDRSGKILGQHKGIACYTIGQRKGLNLAMGHPIYVTELRPETNEVVIGENEDLFSDTVYASDLHFMGVSEEDALLHFPIRANVKIRYAHKGAPATISMENDVLKAVFDTPQRAATPGQSLVAYSEDYILLGGTICQRSKP